MSINFTVYKGSQDGRIIQSSTQKPDLAPTEVLLKVTHSGLCGTDLHFRQASMVLGHEGVGVVQKVGSAVKNFKVGDRAGWGYQHSSCGHCEQCLVGEEPYCPDGTMYGVHDLDQGSFASHAVWNTDFLFHIPEAIDSVDAAPLMCGGATVFSALYTAGARSTDRIGVLGVGGLGHIAIQFAAKMGCEVVVFSGTESKREEALKLGAKEFYVTKGLTKLDIGKKINHLLITTSMVPDLSLYMTIVAPNGVIHPLTISNDSLSVPSTQFITSGLILKGNAISSRAVQNKMLEFAAMHKIKPVVETFPMNAETIEKAMNRLNDGKVRYRAVLIAQDL